MSRWCDDLYYAARLLSELESETLPARTNEIMRDLVGAALFDSMADRGVRAKAEARDFWQHETFIETVYGRSCDKKQRAEGAAKCWQRAHMMIPCGCGIGRIC
jgi:hypothetical protein